MQVNTASTINNHAFVSYSTVLGKVLIMSEKIQNKEIKKEDGRVRYTKMRIRTAFAELLKEIGYEKITVTSICDRAEINRATFYKHYLDVPDLVDNLQEETIERLSLKLDEASSESDIQSFLVELLDYLKNNNEGHSVIEVITPSGASNFTLKISALMYRKFSKFIDPRINSLSKSDRTILFSYLAGGSAGIIDYWLKTGFNESKEAIANKIIRLTASTIASDG